MLVIDCFGDHATVEQCTEYSEEYNSCRGIGSTYQDGVDIGDGGAYRERQEQYCNCCP